MEPLMETVLHFLRWLFGKMNKRIVVRRVSKPQDRSLYAAFSLYERRLPENERDSFDNIVRWLRECQERDKRKDAKFRDYLLLASAEGRICGIFYGTYYARTRLLLVGYLVSDNRSRAGKDVVPALLRYIKRLLQGELRDCVGIVFEVEHFAYADSPKKCRRCRAREEYFRGCLRGEGLVVKSLSFDYCQPRLSLWDSESKEEPQVLMYGRTQPPPLANTLPKSEVAAILDTIYNDWYGDCYEDAPERSKAYRAYLRHLYEEKVAALPDEVPTDVRQGRPRPSRIIVTSDVAANDDFNDRNARRRRH